MKEIIENLLKTGMSLNKIAIHTGKSLTSIRYWVKKCGLTPNFENFKDKGKTNEAVNGYKECITCKLNLPLDAFSQSKKRIYCSCKKCSTKSIVTRSIETKLKWVESKGGKCILCNYNKHYSGLDFHHLDPSTKKFKLSSMRHRINSPKIEAELNKCVLICANCHREVEAGVTLIPDSYYNCGT